MDQVAIFVDAGYLFAQGSVALTGSQKKRATLVLDAEKVVQELIAVARNRAPECRLLRVYWYDGVIGGFRPTTDQAFLAHLDNVKLRLGAVNGAGQQKGVDSLIVTDLIELARLKSISDALLLSGDEDVRIGVQITQNYGVRVHLLGIVPARGSQSPQLLQEADTTLEWDDVTIRTFLSFREDMAAPVDFNRKSDVVSVVNTSDSSSGEMLLIETIVEQIVNALSSADLQGISVYWQTDRGVPPDFDRKLLPKCGAAIGRALDTAEKRHARACFQKIAQVRLGQAV